MSPEAQTWSAAAIVGLTLALFTWRWWRSRGQAGCGGGCGCPTKPKNVRPPHSSV